MGNTEDNNTGLFDGEKGESLFTRPFMMSPSRQTDHNTEMPELFEKIKKESGNDRSFVITTSLVIEHNIDRFLQILIPGYDGELIDIKDYRRDLEFGLKIRLMKALKIIPKNILDCVDCVKNVRNDFAHDLDIDSLELISETNKKRLETYYRQSNRYKYYDRYYKNSEPKSIRDSFHAVSYVAALGIRSYESNIITLREIIQSGKFLEKLELYNEIKVWKEHKESMQLGPIEIKVQNNQKVEIFQKGIAFIDPHENEIKETIDQLDVRIKELEQKLLKESMFDI